MHHNYDLVIVGGGMVGASLALALAETGCHIALIERHLPTKPAQFDPKQVSDVASRVSAISFASQQWFERLGVWQTIPESRRPAYCGMEVWDSLSSGELLFRANDVHRLQLGWIVENQQLVHGCYLALADTPQVKLISETLVSAEPKSQGVALTLASGDALFASLLVAADGSHSWVREQLGFPVRQWSYHQSALVATVATAMPHGATAYQRFAPQGPLAFLPLSAPHLSSIVWSLDDQVINQVRAWSSQELRNQLALALDRRLGFIEDIASIQYFPLRQCHAQRYFKGATVLVGDAAHSLHPLAGQGVNLGCMDAAVLVEEIRRACALGKPCHHPSVLMAYERRRMVENLAAMSAMELFKRLFVQENLACVLARQWGMRVFNQSLWLKRKAIMVALGLVGDVPSWLKLPPNRALMLDL